MAMHRIMETSRGFAVVDDAGKVVSLHPLNREGHQAASYEAAQAGYAADPGVRTRPPQMPTPQPPPREPSAVQAALERSRQPLRTALDPPQEVTAAPVEIEGGNAPRYRVHQVGGVFVVGRNGQQMARFDDEAKAIEHVNMLKYADSRGIDLEPNIPRDAPPVPAMARGQTGEAEEELGVTKKLTDPYYGTTPDTRYVGPYRGPGPDQ